jgi:hypothetical protein
MMTPRKEFPTMKMRISLASAALLSGLMLASPASAQQQNRRNDQNEPQQAQSRQRDAQQAQSRRSNQQAQSQQDNQTQWRLEPEGWIKIAVDRDGDGRFDAIETIHAFDLERAQRASRQRRQDQQHASQYRARESRRPGPRMGQMNERQMFRIEGKLAYTQTVQLRGIKGKELIGRVQTQDGRVAKVALGPQNQLKDLNLQEGDQVTVLGKVGAINDRAMLIAYDVRANGNTIRVNRPPGVQGLRHFSGEIEKTRTAKLRNVDQKQTVARVRLDEGPTIDVILGPQSDVQRLNLQQGDEVAFLGYQARLDRRPALVAEEVAAHNQIVENDLPDREQFRHDNQRQAQRNQQRSQRNR